MLSMKNGKKNMMVGVRIDEELRKRLEIFEGVTGVPHAQLARSALEAALDSFEKKGTITFPLVCMSQEEFNSEMGQVWSESWKMALESAKENSSEK